MDPLNVYTGQNPRRHVVLKNTGQMRTIVHRLEGICLLVYTFASASLLGGGTEYIFADKFFKIWKEQNLY